jgi:hypothetical protein
LSAIELRPLRALLQRRRNRDLFDLHERLEQLPVAPGKLIACFDHYLALEGNSITRAMAEQRMLEKLTQSVTEDVSPMLPAGVRWTDADAIHAFERVWTELIARIGGEPWKLDSRRRECCREPSRSNFRSVEHF